MKAKALYNVTIEMLDYKKWEIYEIEKQVNIAWRDYFEILEKSIPKEVQEVKQEKAKKSKKQEVETVETVEEVKENFETLEK